MSRRCRSATPPDVSDLVPLLHRPSFRSSACSVETRCSSLVATVRVSFAVVRRLGVGRAWLRLSVSRGPSRWLASRLRVGHPAMQLCDKQPQRVHRLAQVVAGGGEKTRFALAGFERCAHLEIGVLAQFSLQRLLLDAFAAQGLEFTGQAQMFDPRCASLAPHP